MSNQLTSIDFHGQTLLATIQDNVVYTALKPICENIGLSWNAQFERIKRDEVLAEGIRMIRTPTKGGFQDVVCLPLTLLNGWLFGVDTNRVKAQIKDKLITYKKECYQVLFDYWHKGMAVNGRLAVSSTADRVPLKDAINLLVAKSGLNYSECYKLVHQYMNVEHIDEIALDHLPLATAYVHSLIIQCNEPRYQYANNERLVSFVDDNHHLWTRPLADNEHIVRMDEIPKLLMTATDITHDELLAINYVSSARLASGLKHLPSLVFSDNTKEV